MLFWVWSYVQPLYSSAVAATTNLLLTTEEWGRHVTTLHPVGPVIEVYSALRTDGRPVGAYDAELLHFYVVLSLSIVLAYPGPRVRKRLVTLLATLAAIFAFQALALLVTVEHTYAITLKEIAERIYTPTEASVYQWLYETLVYLPIQLMPAAVLLFIFARHGGLGGGKDDSHGKAAARRVIPDAGRRPARFASALAVVITACATALGGWLHIANVRARQADDLCASGWRALRAGAFDEASTLLRTATVLDGSLVEAHDGLGNARLKGGDPASAERAFREALSRNPDYFPSRIGLGGTLFALGRAEEAVEEYRRARDLAPDRWEGHYDLAQALIRAGRREEAEPSLEKTIELNPGFADARWELAVGLMTGGRICEALPHLEAYASLEPGSANADLVRETIGAGRARCASRPGA